MPTTNLNETQLYEEYNQLTSFEILNQSQELIQDLVHKTSDIILTLRASLNSFLYGEQGPYQARKAKIEELFRNLESTFSRLRVAGSVINQRKIAIDQRKLEEKISNTELDLRPFEVEKEELIEKIRLKNSYIKLAIDKVGDIIWQINSIQNIKH